MGSKLNKDVKNLNTDNNINEENIEDIKKNLSEAKIYQEPENINIFQSQSLNQNMTPIQQISSNQYQNYCSNQQETKPDSMFSQSYVMQNKINFSNENSPLITYINHGADENLHVLSVIITILKDSSYDEIYRVIPQTSPEGRVAVFQINPLAIGYFLKKFNDENFTFDEEFKNSNSEFVENFTEIFEYLKDIEPDCVLFNYECCSACGDFMSFSKKENTLKLIDIVMKRGSYFMFSDFSVKSLLLDWDENILGKNPFLQIGSNSSHFDLKFDKETLQNCDSAQLKTVGNLSENGSLSIHVMGGTIVFGLDKEKIDEEKYKLEILTIADNIKDFLDSYEESDSKNFELEQVNQLFPQSQSQDQFEAEAEENQIPNNENLFNKKNEKTKQKKFDKEKYFVELKNYKGAIGHVVLHYKSGGKLFLSAGHWIELSKVNVKLDDLEKVSKNLYSNKYDNEIEKIKNEDCNEYTKSKKYSELATKVIQQSSNCNYSKKMIFKSQK
jgi:hypothetical protein